MLLGLIIKCKRVISKKINLQNYKNQFNFEQLPPGEKSLEISLDNKLFFRKNFTVLGKSREPIHITNLCKIKTSDSKYNISNLINLSSNKKNSFNNGIINIKIPKSKEIDGIYLRFFSSSNNYSIISYSKKRKKLNNYNISGFNMIHKYFKLNEDSKEITINLYSNDSKYIGICSLRVYEKGKVGVSVERWAFIEKCDLMVISSHRDDELLFFGGTIPFYALVKKKKVCTIFMSGTGINRTREALSSQWSMGIKNYPIFMGFPGGFHKGIYGTIKDWGGEENVLNKIVEIIRHYKPDVIVTHDIKGEYGHPTHRTVPFLVKKAIKLASDKNKFIYSYKNYGVHDVKKVYFHLYKKNKIIMNWNKESALLDYKTSYQVACIGYDKYYSQHKKWGMSFKRVKKYPNYLYGLVHTTVGKDIKKDDFFENID
jgi:LmbE family N-acetylglucosaminyl deacetylase